MNQKTLPLPEWDRDSQKEPVSEPSRKRPPLTGKNRFAPDGLYDKSWENLNDAYGSASLTPYYIEALTSDDEGDIQFGIDGLRSATTHQGSVYSASKAAVPFLAELLRSDNKTASEWACHFLARIALGESFYMPHFFHKTSCYSAVKKYSKEIKAYYERTGSDKAQALLCFMPKALPDCMDLSYDCALRRADGDERKAFKLQAASLVAQGFVAAERNYKGKGFPQYAAMISNDSLTISGHIKEVRELRGASPSLLVRGCAAVCLAYTGVIEPESLYLLEYIASQDFRYVDWAWEPDFSLLAKQIWFYAADADTMLGSQNTLFSQQERIFAIAPRVFTEKYTNSRQILPLLPSELTDAQRKLLQSALEYNLISLAPALELERLNIPETRYAALRLLGQSNESLCAEVYVSGSPLLFPLWYALEKAVIEDAPEAAAATLRQVNVWDIMPEIYRRADTASEKNIWEKCTLSIGHYKEKTAKARQENLQSILADALAGYHEQIRTFLDSWLPKAAILDAKDPWAWHYETAGQRIGISLLALARSGMLEKRYYPLIRPYHASVWHSCFPVTLLKEILSHTPEEFQAKIKKAFHFA